jgi:hypothetical protein
MLLASQWSEKVRLVSHFPRNTLPLKSKEGQDECKGAGFLIISMRAPIQPFENTSISFQDAESRADSGKCSRRTIQLRQFSQPNAFQKESDTHFEMHPSGKG